MERSTTQQREWLSALMDGQPDALSAGCSAWRDDADARAQWHAYHVIGDVLRCEDLARRAGGGSAFVATLRERLDAEPVVLAPARHPDVQAPARRRWLAPAAAAAGFVAVAGVLVVLRSGAPQPAGGAVIAAAPAQQPRPVVAAPAPPPMAAVVADGALIRNARLDRYLAAHKQYGGSSALGLPGSVLQRTATAAPER